MLKGIRECTREPVLWRTEDHGSKKPRTSVRTRGVPGLWRRLGSSGLSWHGSWVSCGWLRPLGGCSLPQGLCLEVACDHFSWAGCRTPGGPSEKWWAGASQYCSFPAVLTKLGECKGNSLSAGGKTRQPVGVLSLQQFKQVRGKWVLEMVSLNNSFYRLAD